MDFVGYIVSILSGVAVAIPLVIKLVEYVRMSVKEKNWGKLLELVMSLIEQAENKFDDGATRKEWVLAMVKASASTINYDVDVDSISNLIDSLCGMAKSVNVKG